MRSFCTLLAIALVASCAPEQKQSYEPRQKQSYGPKKLPPLREVKAIGKKPLSISFEEFDALFGLESGKTDLQKKDAFKRYRNKCVEWTGELVYANEGLFGLSVGFKHLPGTFTYDTLVEVPSAARDVVLKMNKGQRYRYKGTLKDYGGVLPISLDWGCQ